VVPSARAVSPLPSSKAEAASPVAAHQPVLQKYCFGCHNERTKSGNLTLDNLDLAHVADNAEVWEKVIRKLRAGVMPPRTAPHPDSDTYRRLISSLENEIDRVAALRPDPGPMEKVHRLNRAEYQNAVRDVLALDIDASNYLPADEVTNG